MIVWKQVSFEIAEHGADYAEHGADYAEHGAVYAGHNFDFQIYLKLTTFAILVITLTFGHI